MLSVMAAFSQISIVENMTQASPPFAEVAEFWTAVNIDTQCAAVMTQFEHNTKNSLQFGQISQYALNCMDWYQPTPGKNYFGKLFRPYQIWLIHMSSSLLDAHGICLLTAHVPPRQTETLPWRHGQSCGLSTVPFLVDTCQESNKPYPEQRPLRF